MQVDYIHGNPMKGKLNIRKPSNAEIEKTWGKDVAKKLKKAQMSNPARKTAKKAVKKSTIKKPSSSKITLEEAKQLFSNNKSQGGTTMARKPMSKAEKKAFAEKMKKARAAKASGKTTKKVAKKATKKVAKKVAKKVTAKKVVKKVIAKKTPAQKAAKKAKARKGVAALRHATAMARTASSSSVVKGHDVYIPKAKRTRDTKMPMPVRLLKKGEQVEGELTRIVKKKKKNKDGSISVDQKQKKYAVKVVRTNPKKKKKSNPVVVSKNPIVVSNPKKKKKYSKRNPIVSFKSNPVGSIVSLESRIISKTIKDGKTIYGGFLGKTEELTQKFLNVGVLEITGLAFGAGLDGAMLSLVSKIPKSEVVLDFIPEEFQAPAMSAFGGLVLHGLNAFLAKKGGKKSVLLEEISKGMIAAAIVKAVSSLSPLSAENKVEAPMAGYQYTPSMSGLNGAGLGGYIQSNPSASMKASNADFSGADFQGADFQGTLAGDNVGGADFDGYVSTLGDEESMDFGSDNSSMSGNW